MRTQPCLNYVALLYGNISEIFFKNDLSNLKCHNILINIKLFGCAIMALTDIKISSIFKSKLCKGMGYALL